MGRGPVGAPAIIRYVNNSLGLVTDVSGSDGAMKLITTKTASSDSDISFVNGSDDVVLDSTYPIYLFKFINVHSADNNITFQVNFRDGGSSYDATKTTTFFEYVQLEDGTGAEMGYAVNNDVGQGTGVHTLTRGTGNDNDECVDGELWLFNPSSTTYVKHFLAEISDSNNNGAISQQKSAGYCNVTAAIDAVQFTFSSGNIDAGTFKLYGIKDS